MSQKTIAAIRALDIVLHQVLYSAPLDTVTSFPFAVDDREVKVTQKARGEGWRISIDRIIEVRDGETLVEVGIDNQGAWYVERNGSIEARRDGATLSARMDDEYSALVTRVTSDVQYWISAQNADSTIVMTPDRARAAAKAAAEMPRD